VAGRDAEGPPANVAPRILRERRTRPVRVPAPPRARSLTGRTQASRLVRGSGRWDSDRMPRSLSHSHSSLRDDAGAELTVRPARFADDDALARLAALDSARPLARGQVLVAEVDGRIVAAVSLHDGRAVADPFAPSADAVEILRVHAAGSRPAKARVRRPWMPRFATLRGLSSTAA
jgi:hypothetical protein